MHPEYDALQVAHQQLIDPPPAESLDKESDG